MAGCGEHDWNEPFFRIGLLDEGGVEAVSGGTRLAGLLVMVAGFACTAFLALTTERRRRLFANAAARHPALELLLD